MRMCKDTLYSSSYIETPPFGLDDTGTPAEPASGAAPAASSGGKYVPPSMRGGGRGPGEAMGRPGGSRDDLPTLRVTNISEDTQENDLRDLFGTFGRVARVYVGRDRETGAGKGFAFVSFEEKAVAQKAMEKLHGRGYDNLILNIQWSRKYFRITAMPIIMTLTILQNQGSSGEAPFLHMLYDVSIRVCCSCPAVHEFVGYASVQPSLRLLLPFEVLVNAFVH